MFKSQAEQLQPADCTMCAHAWQARQVRVCGDRHELMQASGARESAVLRGTGAAAGRNQKDAGPHLHSMPQLHPQWLWQPQMRLPQTNLLSRSGRLSGHRTA